MAEKKNEVLAIVEDERVESVELTTIGGFATEIMTTAGMEGFWASFDTETDEGKMDVFNAINDSEPLTVGEVIEVENFVIAPAEVRDQETGVLKTLPAVTLITPMGEMYRSTSAGVVKTAINIISSFGVNGKMSRIVKVVCKEIDLPGGRRYKKLALVK